MVDQSDKIADLRRALDESGLRRVHLDEEILSRHELRPAHLEGIITSRGLEEGSPYLDLGRLHGIPQRLDAAGFAAALHAALKDSTAGYVMQLRRHGAPIHTRQWNWAQRPTEGNQAWNTDVRMHVGSVSKLITAIAMTRLLDSQGMSPDTRIAPFLPDYWAKGPNVGQITFRHLLTHTSGFDTGQSASDFVFMKDRVAAGTTGVGTYHYENMNFGLCRILLATINGDVSPSLSITWLLWIPNFNDVLWDVVTINAYRSYVESQIFAAACVSGPTLTHPADHALAHDFPITLAGWNSGDLSSMSGGAGWHMSVNDLMAVMNDFRRVGNIVSVAKAQQMLDRSFGIDLVQVTPAGTLYNKNGLWRNGSGQTEQALAYFLPQDMELVVLANSPVGSAADFFRDVVTNLYVDHLHPAFAVPWSTSVSINLEGLVGTDAAS
ncbi:MAG: serine hydrolase domain-containing protein [Mycobacteriales bacterium]